MCYCLCSIQYTPRAYHMVATIIEEKIMCHSRSGESYEENYVHSREQRGVGMECINALVSYGFIGVMCS